MSCNPNKCKELVIKKKGNSTFYPVVHHIPQHATLDLLGLTFQNDCKFLAHIKAKLCKANNSLRADEINLWLIPSAKQRRNPCSGLPAVYPDLSTRHDWPVKKGLCFVCRDRQSGWREIRNALPVIRLVRWGSRTRISALLRRRY